MDDGVVVMSGLRPDAVIESVSLTRTRFEESGPVPVPLDYLADGVSWQVAKIIRSYTDYVNRLVWHRKSD